MMLAAEYLVLATVADGITGRSVHIPGLHDVTRPKGSTDLLRSTQVAKMNFRFIPV